MPLVVIYNRSLSMLLSHKKEDKNTEILLDCFSRFSQHIVQIIRKIDKVFRSHFQFLFFFRKIRFFHYIYIVVEFYVCVLRILNI